MSFLRRTLPCLSLLFTLLTGCASAPSYRVKVDQDSILKTRDQAAIPLRSGEVMEVDSKEPFVIESPGYAPLIGVPLHSRGAEIQVNLKALDQVSNWDQRVVEKKANEIVNSVLKRAHEVEKKIAKREYQEALRTLEILLQSYPQVHTFKWMRVSCLVLVGKKREAYDWAVRTLSQDPDSSDGRALMLQLKQELGVNS